LLLVALAIIAPAFWHVAQAMPPFGEPESLYGQTINELGPKLRNVANMVAAVNFDFRGFDTLGEECMLLGAVTGAVILLRGSRGESSSDRAGRVPGRGTEERTDATIITCRFAATMLLLFGVYVVIHGTVTPGGGFQGGVIAASSFLLLYLGEGYEGWRKLMRAPVLAMFEGGGAFAYVLAASLPLLLGRAALENILPYGTYKDLLSGGLMVVVNLAVAFSVVGSFGLLLLEFMEETRAPDEDPVPDEADR
jgi:multicomponent Na+:H+ antiporter subunit B